MLDVLNNITLVLMALFGFVWWWAGLVHLCCPKPSDNLRITFTMVLAGWAVFRLSIHLLSRAVSG